MHYRYICQEDIMLTLLLVEHISLYSKELDISKNNYSFLRPPAGSFEHLLNLQFRPEGLGVKIAERSDCNFQDNRNCQVEAVVGFLFL